MKIGNITKLNPREQIAPIPRDNDPTLYFLFRSTISPEKVRELVDAELKTHNLGKIIRPGGKVEEIKPNEDKRITLILAVNFIKALQSIFTLEEHTDENGDKYTVRIEQPLSWDTIDINDISTYPNYTKELEEFGLTFGEIHFLSLKAAEVNMIDDDMVQQAREDFLASVAAQPTLLT